MYTIDTSIYRLLGDKLITTFTYNKLWALSLFTVGDLQAMGDKKVVGNTRDRIEGYQ